MPADEKEKQEETPMSRSGRIASIRRRLDEYEEKMRKAEEQDAKDPESRGLIRLKVFK